MPHWWIAPEAWRDALEASAPVLTELGKLLMPPTDQSGGDKWSPTLTRVPAKWVADAAALCHSVAAALALDGYVARPAQSQRQTTGGSHGGDSQASDMPRWLSRVAGA